MKMPATTRSPLWVRCGVFVGRILRVFGRPRKRILIVRLGSLGDALLFTGALSSIRRQYPDHHITLAASKRMEPIFSRSSDVDSLVAINELTLGLTNTRARWGRVVFAMRLVSLRYDLAIYPWHVNELRPVGERGDVIALFRNLDVDRVVMFSGSKAEEEYIAEKTCTLAARAAFAVIDPQAHELDRTLSLLQAAGCDQANTREDIWPFAMLTKAEVQWAKNELDEGRAGGAGRATIALCPGARFRRKSWGAKNYADLLRRIRRDDIWGDVHVLLLGGTDDLEVAAHIEQFLDAAQITLRNYTGKVSIHESMALIKHSDICIGNDTFGLHAAIAVATPSVVVMWGGDGDRWLPWGAHAVHGMVRANVDCGGCRGVCADRAFACMDKITQEMVLKEMERIWQNHARQ